MAYETVNDKWPEGTREGRDLKPTAQEAIEATRRLYRKFMGKRYPGKFKATSGRRNGYPRGGIYYVNPDWAGVGGWHEVVHFVSHAVASRLYGERHGPRHAFLEREMIAHVVLNGWHLGALKKDEKPKTDIDRKQLGYKRTLDAIKRWDAKRRRAENALKKLARRRRYYEKQSPPGL